MFAGSVHIESRSGDSRSVQAEALRRKPGESACPSSTLKTPASPGRRSLTPSTGSSPSSRRLRRVCCPRPWPAPALTFLCSRLSIEFGPGRSLLPGSAQPSAGRCWWLDCQRSASAALNWTHAMSRSASARRFSSECSSMYFRIPSSWDDVPSPERRMASACMK